MRIPLKNQWGKNCIVTFKRMTVIAVNAAKNIRLWVAFVSILMARLIRNR